MKASSLADPYPELAAFLASQPVFYAEDLGYWVVTRHADCKRVLREYETFSASNSLSPLVPPCPRAGSALAEGGFRSMPTLTNVDPPAHTRTRRIAHLAFTPRRVAQMEGFVRALVRKFLEERLHDGHAELVSALTWELPALVVFHVLGVPEEDVETVKQGSANRLLFMFGKPTEDEQVDIATGMASFWRYCEELAEDRRARPREDFTSDLVHTPDANGEPLTQQEVSTILFGLLLAGHETTTNLLGNSVRRLAESGAWAEIANDRALVPGAVEEVLRFDSSVIHWRRRTTTDAVVERGRDPAGCERARVHRRREPRSGSVRRARPIRHPACERERAPVVRQRTALLSRGATRAVWRVASCSRSCRPRCRHCASRAGRSTNSRRSSGSEDQRLYE